MEKEKLFKLLDKVDELAGQLRKASDEYNEVLIKSVKATRAELYKVFEETRKVRKEVEDVPTGFPCRKCGILFRKVELDINSFCGGCGDEKTVV